MSTIDPPTDHFPDSPGISVITITIDHDTGETSLNVGDLGLHTAWGLLLSAADAVSARLPDCKFGTDDGDEPDEEDEEDEDD